MFHECHIKDFSPSLKTLTIFIFFFLLFGCDHSLQIAGEGDIVSASGGRNCVLESQPCENMVIEDYQETYTAVPRDGWTFVRWEGCPNEEQINHPSCTFAVSADTVKAAWGHTFPLTAIFGETKPLSELEFEDQGIKACVAAARSVYVYEVEELDCSNRRIASLSGVENLTSLRSFEAPKNEITDLSPLASVPFLSELDISKNAIVDHTQLLSLKLNWLTVTVEQEDDYSWLENLPESTKVNISTSRPKEWLSQLPRLDGVKLEGCTTWINPYWRPVIANVERLAFADCQNYYYPLELSWLSDFTNLRGLSIQSEASPEEGPLDISALQSLKKLEVLSLELPHAPQDLSPLSGLESLRELNIRAPILDISFLANLKKLDKLILDENTNADFTPLAELVNLQELELRGRALGDLSAISDLVRLEDLKLIYTSVADLAPIAEHVKLKRLVIIGSENLSDIGPLANLSNLKLLELQYNSISDVSQLSNLSGLNYLWLEANEIVNVSPLASLSELRLLSIGMNPIGGLGVGNIDDLAVLHNLEALAFGFWTDNLSCSELETLIAALGEVVQLGYIECAGP